MFDKPQNTDASLIHFKAAFPIITAWSTCIYSGTHYYGYENKERDGMLVRTWGSEHQRFLSPCYLALPSPHVIPKVMCEEFVYTHGTLCRGQRLVAFDDLPIPCWDSPMTISLTTDCIP